MKKAHLVLLFIFTHFTAIIYSQTLFETEFSEIKKELTNWDPIRGEWLANSVIALANKNIIPDRTFPEDFTPYQMATMISLDQRRGISQLIEQSKGTSNELNSSQWSLVELIFNHSFCSIVTGRSYGDPHLRSFDQATYSFQTVGEFVVSKSTQNHFEVQARQSPQNRNFSLNSAIALNVAGDRLCYYSGDKPDNNSSPWRLDGQPLTLNGRTYFLPHGGTLSLNGRYYTISWPTGENVIVESRSGQFGFVNLTVEVFECDRGQFEGLLGNANGIMEDDFNGRSINRQRPVYASFSSFGNPMLQQVSASAEREYLSFLTREFAEDWRVTDQTSLFDYAIGMSTASYTDRSFPYEHIIVSDLPNDRQNTARRKCEEMGITQEEMPGCIFDNGFLNLNPSPIPSTPKPSRENALNRIERPALNNNRGNYFENINNTSPMPIAEPSKGEFKQPSKENSNDKTGGNSIYEKPQYQNNKEIKQPTFNNTSKPPTSSPSKNPPSTPSQKPTIGNSTPKVKKGK
jgi:hypothetical protein